jgi:hypothetical protein
MTAEEAFDLTYKAQKADGGFQLNYFLKQIRDATESECFAMPIPRCGVLRKSTLSSLEDMGYTIEYEDGFPVSIWWGTPVKKDKVERGEQ